jgi:hypothetical protein
LECWDITGRPCVVFAGHQMKGIKGNKSELASMVPFIMAWNYHMAHA